MTFHVGQWVCCIRDDFRCKHDVAPDIRPVVGGVYQIAEIVFAYGRDYLVLNEFDKNDAWGACHFRPIIERKTDISWAHEILRRETIEGHDNVRV